MKPTQYATGETSAPVSWYALHTKSMCELMVYDALLRKGFRAYLPMQTKIIRHARQKQVVARPLFPRYLFIGFDPARLAFSEVRKTHGVEWFVTNATKPVQIKSAVIDALRESEEEGLFDETAPKPKREIPLKVGDRVTILEGPFANLAATIMAVPSERRIEVLINLFGRPTKMMTALANLQRVA